MSRKLDKLVVGAMALLSTGVFADTHVWKAEGRVNDWNWNEPGNYDSSLGAAGVPEAGDIVQLPDSADIFVLGTDDASMGIVSGLSQVVTPAADSRVIFDLGSGVDLSVNGAISSVLEAERKSLASSSEEHKKGTIVKRGDGTLRLSRVRYSDGSGNDTYAYYTAIVCEEGALHMPELPSTTATAYTSYFYGYVSVSNGATLFVVSCPYKDVPTTSMRRLYGEGVVTNAVTRRSGISVANRANDPDSDFSGVIGGAISIAVPGRLMMRSTGNVHTYYTQAQSFLTTEPWRGAQGLAVFGVQKIGNVGEASSLGPNGMIGYTARAGAFLYLGEGEITDKNFTFETPMERPALFDAGATGGINFTGDVVHASDSDIVTLRLGGDNTSACTLKGAVSNGVYFVKEGSGTWRFADDPCYSESRRFAQSMILDGGTLQFDSMEERGWRCSLGTAASPSDVYWGARNDAAHPSEFAYLSGTNAASIMEFAGTNGAYATQRPIGLRGNLTLKNDTSHPWRFSGVRPATTGAKTLVLDASQNIANELAGISDDAASPVSVTKTGIGSWTLNGSNVIHGTVHVANGTLKVRNASGKFRYYKLTIRDSGNPGKGSALNIGEIGLYDASGNQINKGYSRNDNYHEISAGQIALARFGAHWPAGFNSLCNGKSDQTNLRVIENGANMKLSADNVWTHIPVLFCLPDNAADVASYDILFYSNASSSPGYTPGNWVLEASPDMIHWTCLHDVTSVDATGMGADTWVFARTVDSHGTSSSPLPATHEGGYSLAADSATIPCTVLDNATVSVAKGATLETSDSIAISKLRLDGSSAGNGSISGFSFAEDGDLEVVNLNADDRVEIDVDISNVEGKSNLSKWGLTATAADGSRLLRKAIMSSAGKLSICANGLVVIVK